MNKQRAEQIIVISLIVMLASTVGGTLAEGYKTYETVNEATGKKEKTTPEKYYGKKIVGGFLAMLFASLLAEVAPAPAAYMSVAMSGYAFFHYGLPAINGRYAKEKAVNLRNPRERLPATPGPEVNPTPLQEATIA